MNNIKPWTIKSTVIFYIIDKRKVWVNKYMEILSNDLKDNGTDCLVQSLYRMSRMAKEFTKYELFSQPTREI